MTEYYPCVICGEEQVRTVYDPQDRDYERFDRACQHCPRCGEFWLNLKRINDALPQETQVKLSAWVREQNMLNKIPEIDGDQIKRIATMPIPSPLERADRILIHVVRHQKSLNEIINHCKPELQAISYSQNQDELDYLVKSLVDQGFLEYIDKIYVDQDLLESIDGGYRVTLQGHKRYGELHALGAASTQAFVAMWFDPSMQDAYEKGLEAGILKAGYDPVRIDGVEHVGKIDDRIIAEIRRSKFLVADFTEQRGGVYFEAGFALGLDLPVIWTCRKDDIENLHFDVRQYNCIDWTEPSELAERLTNRIGEVIRMGPRQVSDQE